MLFDTFSIAFQAEAVSKAIKSLSDPVITETTAVSGGIKLTWAKDENATTTYIYRKLKGEDSFEKIASVKSDSYTDKTVKIGKTYVYKIKSYVKSSGNAVYSKYSKTVTAVTQKPGKVSSVTISNKGKQNYLYISWKARTSASKYQIYRSTAVDGTYKRIATVSKAYYEDTSIKSNRTYYYKMRAVRTYNSKNYYGSFSDKIAGIPYFILSAPKITKVDAAYDSITIYWNKISSATGYKVYRKNVNNGSKFVYIGKTKNSFFIDDDFSLSAKYEYYIKAYSKVNTSDTVQSVASNKVSVNTSKIKTSRFNLSGYFADENTFKLSWSKQKGSYGYEIVYSKDVDLYEKNLKRIYIKGETNTSVKIKNLAGYVQVRAYTVDGIVNYMKKSYIMIVSADDTRDKFLAKYNKDYGREITYITDYNGITCIADINHRNSPEDDKNLYCHVCDKKGCTINSTTKYFLWYCFKCKKQISSMDCHPTSHVLYTNEYLQSHSDYCSVCGKTTCIRSSRDYNCVVCKKTIKAHACHPKDHYLKSH